MGTELIATQSQKTPEYMTDHHYLNMLTNSIIDYETGGSLEYRHLIKLDKHKNTWVECFSNELGRLAQGVRYSVKGTDTIFSLAHEKIPTYRTKDVTYFQTV